MNADGIEIHVGRTEAAPAESGYRPEKIAQLDAHYQQLIAGGKLQSASYLMARHGKIFAWKSMGRLTHKGNGGDLLPDSLRGIASVTKAFTAVCIMRLVEEGHLRLDQSLAEILDEFKNPMHEKIQIFHLLTHTSGISADGGYFSEPYPHRWWEGFDREKGNWLKAILAGPLQNKPGEVWNYCSNGFSVLGEIIERVTEMPYEDYVRRTVFEPLGMSRTFFDVPRDLHAQVGLVTDWDEEMLAQSDRKGWPPRSGGGIHSNLYDLWRFAQMLLDGGVFAGMRILGRKTVEAMRRNHLEKVPAYHWGADFKAKDYGLGLDIYTNMLVVSPGTFGHEGSGRTGLYIDPAEDFIFINFVPTPIGWVPESVVSPMAIAWSGIE